MNNADNRPLAVVLLSGGMDSAVAATLTARTHRLACLHATYGQKTANRERVSFGALAHHLKSEIKQVVNLSHLGALGGSTLTDPDMDVADAGGDPNGQGIPATYVPFRNAHLLAMAVSWAEILGAEQVVIGAVEEDSSGYPDCTAAFYRAFQGAVQEGTRPETDITLVTPVIGMSKVEIVRRGQELGTPFHLTWSCYREEAIACGRCDSCVLRLRGFAGARLTDPLRYAPGATQPDSSQRKREVAALTDFLDRVRRS
jgi:7-cyano-7-deazaguanine synthase